MIESRPLFHEYLHTDAAQNGAVLTIESGESFVDVLASHLLHHYQDKELELSRVRILLPTRRACLSLREAFLRLTDGRAVLLPQMSPVFSPDEEEIHFLSGVDVSAMAPPINTVRRLLLIMPLIRRAFPQELNTQQALSLATHLAAFIDNLYIENLSLDDLDMLSPDDPNLSVNWQKTVTFLKVIIAQFWPDILAQNGVSDIGDYRVKLIHAYTEYWRANPPSHPVIIAGTMASVPAVATMIKEILQSTNGYLILPGLDTNMDDESFEHCTEGHPQHLFKTLLTRIECLKESVSILPARTETAPHYAAAPPQLTAKRLSARRILASEMMRPPQTLNKWADYFALSSTPSFTDGLYGIALAEVKNPFEEARLVACIVRDALDTPDQTIMIITPNRKLAALIQKEMKFWDIDIDDSAGQPLAQTSIGRFSLGLINLAYEDFSPLAFLNVLKNEFCHGGENWPSDLTMQEFIKNFEIDFCRGPRAYKTLSGLNESLQEKWAQREILCAAWQSLYPVFQSLEELAISSSVPAEKMLHSVISQMENLSSTADTHGESLLWRGDSGEGAASFFASLLDSLRGDVTFSLKDFHEFLLHLMQGMSIRPKYGMHPRVRLLGLAESRLQTADTVILAGLNEGSWPSDPGHNPWMSRPMLNEYGFPTPERALSQSAHDFIQGFCSARVFLTRSLSMDGTLSVPSRWLARFKTILEATDKLESVRAVAAPHIQRALLLPVADKETQPITQPAPTLQEKGYIKNISITDIGALLSDPYAIYAKRVLRIKPLDPIDQQPDVLLRGQIIHKALEIFTENFPRALPADPKAELIKCGKTVFAPYQDWNADIHAFWWPRFIAMASWFEAYEQSWRAPDNIIFAEKSVNHIINTGKGEVTLRGRADRIEKHQDGWVVIDYKTGSPPTKKDIMMGYAPQLSITGALILNGAFEDLNAHKSNMDEDVIKALHYWKIAGQKSGAQPVNADKDTSLTAVCSEAYDGFCQLLRYYNDEGGAFISFPLGSAYAAPMSGDYEHLSRISEWSVNDEADNDMQEEAA